MVDVDDIEEAEILLDIVENKNINCSVQTMACIFILKATI